MATDAVRIAVTDLIKTAVLATRPGTPIAHENQKFAQPKGEPWVHIAFNANESHRKDIGAGRTWRHMGIVIVNIMVPEDSGTKLLNELSNVVFNAVADRSIALPGADGYLKLCYGEKRVRGVVNGWYVHNVQVEYHQDVVATD